MKQKPKVGQIVFSLNVGNAARYAEQKLTPKKVDAVGRKYFTVNGVQFHLDNWRQKTMYSADQEIFSSETEYNEMVESNAISRSIAESFAYGRNVKNVPIESLREILGILSR